MSRAPDEDRKDPWSLNPTMALGFTIIALVSGLALALDGELWGMVLVAPVPLFAWAGVRGWRQGLRF
jgi:hypothetical protein